MGDVIPLIRRRSSAPSRTSRAAAPPDGAGGPRVTFYFDLGSPWTYLAAERAERLFGGGRWGAALGEGLLGGGAGAPPRGRGAARRPLGARPAPGERPRGGRAPRGGAAPPARLARGMARS